MSANMVCGGRYLTTQLWHHLKKPWCGYIYCAVKLCMMCKRYAACLGEMLYGSVHMTSVLFDSSHVPVDGACLLWFIAVLQQLQGPLTLVQGLVWSALPLMDPIEQKGQTLPVWSAPQGNRFHLLWMELNPDTVQTTTGKSYMLPFNNLLVASIHRSITVSSS